jgi:hypothetical protein
MMIINKTEKGARTTMRSCSKSIGYLLALLAVFAISFIPGESAAAPAFPIGDVQSMRSLVSIEDLTYGPFTKVRLDKGTSDKFLFVGGGNGILQSDDIPALDGRTTTISQGFMIGLQNTFRDVLDGTSNTIRGRTTGDIYLTFQDGEDIVLRFDGYFKGLFEDKDSDGYIDTITLAVDAAGGEMLKKLDLALVGQIDLASREISALSGEGILEFASNPATISVVQ